MSLHLLPFTFKVPNNLNIVSFSYSIASALFKTLKFKLDFMLKNKMWKSFKLVLTTDFSWDNLQSKTTKNPKSERRELELQQILGFRSHSCRAHWLTNFGTAFKETFFKENSITHY